MALLECALYALVQHGTSQWWICGSFCLKVAANGRFCWTFNIQLTCFAAHPSIMRSMLWCWRLGVACRAVKSSAFAHLCNLCLYLFASCCKGRQRGAHCLVIKDSKLAVSATVLSVVQHCIAPASLCLSIHVKVCCRACVLYRGGQQRVRKRC